MQIYCIAKDILIIIAFVVATGRSFSARSRRIKLRSLSHIAFHKANYNLQVMTSETLASKLSLLVLDFDDTITSGDTTPLLPHLASLANPPQSTHIFETWSHLTDSYIQAYYGALNRGIEEKCEDKIISFMRSLTLPELESITRASETKVLAGMSKAHIQAALEGPLRDKWGPRDPYSVQSITRILSQDLKMNLHILSINFSEVVIRTILSSMFYDLATLSKISVHCNDLAVGSNGLTTGEILVRVVGAEGKLEKFKLLCSNAPCEGMTMYVGDSITDVLALLHADIGVVVGMNSALRKIASTFGIDIVPLPVYWHSNQPENTGDKVLYEAESWAQIEEFLLGEAQNSP